MTFKDRWIDLLYRAATGGRRVRHVFTPIGAVFFGLLLVCFVVLSRYADRLIGLEDLFPGRLPIVLSLPLFAVAAFLIGWSVGLFLKAGGTPVPVNPPPKLVASGPYAYSRNPMLTGVFALLFGLGVLLESATLLLAFTPLFIALMVWELKAIEEPELVKRFGREYVEYREKTPMFFPRIFTGPRMNSRGKRTMGKALSLFRAFSKLPGGKALFSRALTFRAPYFSTIHPQVLELQEGLCRVRIKDRRSIRNHLGTIHAGAMCTLSELTGGLAVDAAIPESLRWIPKKMTVAYLKKAKGPLVGTCRLDPEILIPGDVGIDVEINDAAADTVLKAAILFYISKRKAS